MSRGLRAAPGRCGPGVISYVPGQGLAPPGQCARACGGGKGTAVRAQSWPWVQSPVPHVWARPVGSSLGRDWGHWVNLQELWVLRALGLQEPVGRIHLVLSPSSCSSRLGGEPLPSDNSFSLWISKPASLRSGQFSFRLARWQ